MVTVRVVDITKGHPLPRQQVSINLRYDKGQAVPAIYNASQQYETNSNGETQIVLPEPPPKYLDINVRIDDNRWHCGCVILANIQEVTQKGILVPPPCFPVRSSR